MPGGLCASEFVWLKRETNFQSAVETHSLLLEWACFHRGCFIAVPPPFCKHRLRDSTARTTIRSVQRVLAIFLALVIVQLIPSCGSAMATEAAQMTCCKTKCPMQSPAERSGCCQRAMSPSSAFAPAPVQQPTGLLATAVVPIALYVRPIAQVTLIAYRSPAPPPRNSRAALCSLQI